MRWMTVAATVLLTLAVLLAVSYPQGRSATLQWDYDYSKNPPCDVVVKGKRLQDDCILGFNAFLDGPAKRTEQQFVPNRFDQGGHVVEKAISVVLPVRRYGQVDFCVTALGRDQHGRSVESFPVCSQRWVLPFSGK